MTLSVKKAHCAPQQATLPFMQGSKPPQIVSSIRKFNLYIKRVKNVAYITTSQLNY
jgi:hypothetical protein